MAREHAAVVDEADAVPAVDFRRVQPAGGRIYEDVDDEERPVRAERGGREDVGDVQEPEARRAAHGEVEEKEVHDGRVAPRGVALAVAEQLREEVEGEFEGGHVEDVELRDLAFRLIPSGLFLSLHYNYQLPFLLH